MHNLPKRNQKSDQSDRMFQVFSPLLTIQNEIDKAMQGFGDLFEPKLFNLKTLENMAVIPMVDLVEDNDSYKIEVEMPGVDEKDIKVAVNDNLLTIQGEKKTSKKNDNKNYISREINYGQYARSIMLPKAADGNKITASFKKGMLWITIPKKKESIATSHEIKVEKA